MAKDWDKYFEDFDRRLKILEIKMGEVINKLNCEFSNLEMGYEWGDCIEREIAKQERIENESEEKK